MYKKSALTQSEAQTLVRLMRGSGGMALEQAHTDKGMAWIKKYHADRFPQWVLDDFHHFSFRGMAEDTATEQARQIGIHHYTPVWRIHGNAGQWLDYASAAWQSGGNGPRILRDSSTVSV